MSPRIPGSAALAVPGHVQPIRRSGRTNGFPLPFASAIVVELTAFAAWLHGLQEASQETPETVDGFAQLQHSISIAVPSFLGLIMIIDGPEGQVAITLPAEQPPAATSLRLPMICLSPNANPKSAVILHAATPGAFIDLAADLTFYLKVESETIRLDQDLLRTQAVEIVSGIVEITLVNRTLGFLLDRGFPPDAAMESLRLRAVQNNSTLAQAAQEILDQRDSDNPGRAPPLK